MTTLALQNDLGVNPFVAIERAELSHTTKRQYRRAIELYLDAGYKLGDSEALAIYSQNLKKSSKAFLKAAVKLWTQEIERVIKSQATPENVNAIQATVYRLESVNDAIKVKTEKGNKAHTWLKPIETKKLLDSVNGDDIVSQRDRLVLALLIGAGLRRNELIELKFENVEKLGDRTVLSVSGKGDKTRVIPVSNRIAELLESWKNIISDEGYIIRSLGMNREPGKSISGQAILDIVAKYGMEIEKPKLQPHDLRRTFAQFAVDNGIPIQRVSKLLGHASIQTTMRYLNLETDLEIAPSDFIPL
jgi:site-specific recombinase XerD